MKIKKFTGPDFRSTMDRVKADFGEDAVILHTKSISEKGLRGLLGSPRVEITAAVDLLPEENPGQSRKSPAISSPLRNGNPVPRSPQRTAARAVWREPLAPVVRPAPALPREKSWVDSLERLPGKTRPTPEPGNIREPQRPVERVRDTLLERGFAPELVERLVLESDPDGKLISNAVLARNLREAVAKRFRTAGPVEEGKGRQRIVALVGATGVGKTTTLVKIASEFHARGRKVGFLTADTYRVAAVDQLRRYAEILGVPLEVVYGPEEVEAALGKLRNCEMVFVDTAGRSQNHETQMNELKDLLARLPGVEIHLVLSAPSVPSTQRGQIERFGALGARRVIFTKIDELMSGAPLLELGGMTHLPISYVTDGQEVPKDIRSPRPSDLAVLVLTLGAARWTTPVEAAYVRA